MMASDIGPKGPETTPQHADYMQTPTGSAPAPNPFARAAQVTVTVPEKVGICLVDASTLQDYEVWTLITSILSSAVVGFFVAYLQAAAGLRGLIIATAIVFFILDLIAGRMAFVKRQKIFKKGRMVSFRLGEMIPEVPAEDNRTGEDLLRRDQ